MLQFVLGRAGSGKTEEILSRIAAEHRETLLLVPEQFSFETERALHRRLGVRAAANVQVLSFSRLAERVLREAGGIAEQVMDDVTRMLLLSRALEIADAPEMQNGTPARTSTQDTAYLSALLALSDECKRCAVTPRMLSLTADALAEGALKHKLTNLAAVLGAYEALTAATGIDPTDLPALAAEKLPDCDLWTGAAVFVDGFRGFTAAELQLLTLLLRRADVTVSLGVPTAAPVDECDLFAPVARSLRELQTAAVENGVPIAAPYVLTENRRALDPALAALERYAFASRPVIFDAEAAAVTITACGDIHSECAAAARAIRRILRTTDIRARDIAVVVRTLAPYAGILDAALRREGIPCYLDTPIDVYTAPLLSLTLAAVRCATTGFRTEEILKIVKCGLLRWDAVRVGKLENYVYMWRIDGQRWTRPFTANPAGLTDDARFDREALDELEDMRKNLIDPLCALRDALRTDPDGAAFSAAVYTYLIAVGADTGVREVYAALCAEGEPALADITARLWDVVMDLLDRFAAVFAGQPLPAGRYADLLHLAAGLTRLPSVPQSLDAVQIGAADHVRLSSPRAVYILGANEGVFPAYPGNDNLLTDRDREQLAAAGLTLSGDRLQKAAQERYFAYLALAAPREQLSIFYCTVQNGENAAPSVLVRTVEAVLPHHAAGAVSAADGSDIESPAEGFDRLAAIYESGSPLAATLRAALQEHPRYAAFTAALERTLHRQPFTLSKPVAAALFGTEMQLSSSQADSFHRCRFRYFCQYGMRLQTRKIAEVDTSLFGTLTHAVLETLLPRYIRHDAETAPEPPDIPALQQAIHSVLFTYVEERMGGLADRPARFRYQLSLVERTCFSLLWFMVNEMAQSRFVPADYELVIGKGGVPSPVLPLANGRGSVHITGKIDRVDIYRRQDDLFIRVVDYKTGKKQFALSDIPYGINMQMLLYLFAVCETGAVRYAAANAVPAGALYLSAKDITLKNAHAPLDSTRLKLLRMNGLVLADSDVIEAMDATGNVFIPAKLENGQIAKGSSVILREDFAAIKALTTCLLVRMAETLLDGDIAALPTGDAADRLPCRYCDYGALCGRRADDPAVIMEKCKTTAALDVIRKEVDGDA